MLTNHTLQCWHSTLQCTKPSHTHYLISADPTPIPVWEQTSNLNLLIPRVALFSILWPGVLGFNLPQLRQNSLDKTYAFMQMAVPICDANLSRENLVPYASSDLNLDVDLKKRGGEECFPYHWLRKATPCSFEKLVTMTGFLLIAWNL